MQWRCRRARVRGSRRRWGDGNQSPEACLGLWDRRKKDAVFPGETKAPVGHPCGGSHSGQTDLKGTTSVPVRPFGEPKLRAVPRLPVQLFCPQGIAGFSRRQVEVDRLGVVLNSARDECDRGMRSDGGRRRMTGQCCREWLRRCSARAGVAHQLSGDNAMSRVRSRFRQQRGSSARGVRRVALDRPRHLSDKAGRSVAPCISTFSMRSPVVALRTDRTASNSAEENASPNPMIDS